MGPIWIRFIRRCIFFLLLSRQPKKRDAHLPPCVHLGARESLSERAAVPLCGLARSIVCKTLRQDKQKAVCRHICVGFFFFFFSSFQILPMRLYKTLRRRFSGALPAVLADLTQLNRSIPRIRVLPIRSVWAGEGHSYGETALSDS